MRIPPRSHRLPGETLQTLKSATRIRSAARQGQREAGLGRPGEDLKEEGRCRVTNEERTPHHSPCHPSAVLWSLGTPRACEGPLNLHFGGAGALP